MVMVARGLPKSVPLPSILRTTSIPFVTFPNTVCFPFNHGVAAVQMKTGMSRLAKFFVRSRSQVRIYLDLESEYICVNRKNLHWDPLVLGPALAMDKVPRG